MKPIKSTSPVSDAILSADGAAMLNRRIDDIVAFQNRKGAPWYRDPSLMISAAAFFISIMTTVVSWYRTYQQDMISLKTELRTISHQANSLILQNVELLTKYKDNHQAYMQASSTLNSQNIVLAKAAYSVVKQLGRSASSMDLTQTASALIQSHEFVLAEELLKEAAKRAEHAVEDVSALRILSNTQLQLGKTGEARESIAKALEVFRRYPAEANGQANVDMTQAYTLVFWANAVGSADCQTVKYNLDRADEHLSSLPLTSPQANTLRSEASRLRIQCRALPLS
jgi:tetratricopeptide (TPR) repeat protein